MRILVISHNVFDNTTSMGKTLYKFFETFSAVELAQLYIHPESPSLSDICNRYFRITDKEAMKSVIFRNKCGDVINVLPDGTPPQSEVTSSNYIYQTGRKRTPLIYIMRDFIWNLSAWDSANLRKWLDEFKPNIIFLASGDYEFIYKIALKISKNRKIPLVAGCFDDFYLYNKNRESNLGRIRQQSFMKTVHETMDSCERIVCICESMKDEYQKLFHKPCDILYTAAEDEKLEFVDKPSHIAYFGSLGLNRNRQLIDIGKELRNINNRSMPHYIDVYSTESRPSILNEMTENNGIIFHKGVSSEQMKRIMKECMAVIHVESFDKKISERTKYSISTKIAESLAYGPCLFAYGPKGIASIDYLCEYDSAIVATSREELRDKLLMIGDSGYRKNTLTRARKMAQANHNSRNNGILIKNTFEKAISSYSER